MSAVKIYSNNDEMIPLKFQLSQNFPNPFKEKTIIKYCVAYKTDIQISIYNSNGKLIKRVTKDKQEAGTYEIEFNASTLPDGIYYYQLKAGQAGKQEAELTVMKEMNIQN